METALLALGIIIAIPFIGLLLIALFIGVCGIACAVAGTILLFKIVFLEKHE